MRVDKASHQRCAIDIDDFMGIALSPTHHHSIGNGKVGSDPFTRSWREHSPTFQQNVGGNIASSGRQGMK
jgi:hypothetical protein